MPPGGQLFALLASVELADLDAEQALTYVAAMERLARHAEALRLAGLAQFADCNGVVAEPVLPGAAKLVHPGGDGTPGLDSFAIDEYAAEANLSHGSAERQLGIALDLRHRLPRVAAALAAGQIPGWRARMVVEATRSLSLAQVRLVEAKILPLLAGLGGKRLEDAVTAVLIDTDPEAAAARAKAAARLRQVTIDPSGVDGYKSGYFCADAADVIRFDSSLDLVADYLGQLGDTDPKAERRAKALAVLADPHAALALMRQATGAHTDARTDTAATGPAGGSGAQVFPQVTLYVHLTRDQYLGTRDGAATLEGAGPISTSQARRLLGHSRVRVQPVIDLDNVPSSDDRFSRGRMREAVVLKNPTCIFPGCPRNSRRSQHDHTVAVPDGKTAIDNLAPPCPHHHNLKTHGDWALAQPFNGIYLWRSPHGRIYLVDRTGTTTRVA